MKHCNNLYKFVINCRTLLVVAIFQGTQCTSLFLIEWFLIKVLSMFNQTFVIYLRIKYVLVRTLRLCDRLQLSCVTETVYSCPASQRPSIVVLRHRDRLQLSCTTETVQSCPAPLRPSRVFLRQRVTVNSPAPACDSLQPCTSV